MNLFAPLSTIVLALSTGMIFGFLLRRAAVSRFDVIVGQLLLRDFTVMKVILTAIVTGSCGIYLCNYLELLPGFHLSKTPVFWSLCGGGLFGIGMSIAGYCPGTTIAAIAEGSRDMITGFAGMLVGSFLFSELSPMLYPFIEQKDPFFQQTISTLLHLPNWVVISCLFGMWFFFVVAIRRFEHSRTGYVFKKD